MTAERPTLAQGLADAGIGLGAESGMRASWTKVPARIPYSPCDQGQRLPSVFFHLGNGSSADVQGSSALERIRGKEVSRCYSKRKSRGESRRGRRKGHP